MRLFVTFIVIRCSAVYGGLTRNLKHCKVAAMEIIQLVMLEKFPCRLRKPFHRLMKQGVTGRQSPKMITVWGSFSPSREDIHDTMSESIFSFHWYLLSLMQRKPENASKLGKWFQGRHKRLDQKNNCGCSNVLYTCITLMVGIIVTSPDSIAYDIEGGYWDEIGQGLYFKFCLFITTWEAKMKLQCRQANCIIA